MRLRHLHLPSIHPRYVPYRLAERVQEHFRRQHLDFKDAPSNKRDSQPPPPPTLVSFTPHPVYTLGRRQTAPLSTDEAARLAAPLSVPAGIGGGGGGGASVTLTPDLSYSLRGGLTTYHGPGQVVLWPVLDLRSSRAHGRRQLTVRCYSRLLEDATIAVLRRLFGIAAFTTADPGVWVRVRPVPEGEGEGGGEGGGEGEGEVAKIAALGVHLRRHVSALGTAVNLDFPGAEVADEGRNAWARIVACGLEGKAVTSVAGQLTGGAEEMRERLFAVREAKEGGTMAQTTPTSSHLSADRREEPQSGSPEPARMVADAWAEELARRLGVEGVDAVGVDETLELMDCLLASGAVAPDERVEEEIGFLQEMRRIQSN